MTVQKPSIWTQKNLRADNWEDTPVPNTEYTEQYAETYSNDGYYDQGYEPEETNGYTYGYEEEEDELRRITTIHPRSYNDAKIIGEAFRENIPVIMNVEEMPDADAKRLVDFASGLAFALEGRIERVTAKVFLLTPSNLEVLGVANSEPPPTWRFWVWLTPMFPPALRPTANSPSTRAKD